MSFYQNRKGLLGKLRMVKAHWNLMPKGLQLQILLQIPNQVIP